MRQTPFHRGNQPDEYPQAATIRVPSKAAPPGYDRHNWVIWGGIEEGQQTLSYIGETRGRKPTFAEMRQAAVYKRLPYVYASPVDGAGTAIEGVVWALAFVADVPEPAHPSAGYAPGTGGGVDYGDVPVRQNPGPMVDQGRGPSPREDALAREVGDLRRLVERLGGQGGSVQQQPQASPAEQTLMQIERLAAILRPQHAAGGGNDANVMGMVLGMLKELFSQRSATDPTATAMHIVKMARDFSGAPPLPAPTEPPKSTMEELADVARAAGPILQTVIGARQAAQAEASDAVSPGDVEAMINANLRDPGVGLGELLADKPVARGFIARLFAWADAKRPDVLQRWLAEANQEWPSLRGRQQTSPAPELSSVPEPDGIEYAPEGAETPAAALPKPTGLRYASMG